MSKELVISSNRHETKVAILEDDQLVEVFFQRANEYSLAGSIHKGRVTRVLPGMQSAFVDLGLERDTFLYVSDFFEESEDFDRLPESRREGREDSRREDSRREESRSDSRRERESRPPRTQESAASATTEVAGESPAGAAEGAPTAAAGERDEEGNGRDRRGRRSRRRRNRGRGFPESKYASAEARQGGHETAKPPASEHAAGSVSESVSQASDEEFSVLPGESLAKYKRSNIEPLDESEEEEIRNLQASSDTAEAAAPATEGESAVGEASVEDVEEPALVEVISVVDVEPGEPEAELSDEEPAVTEAELAEAETAALEAPEAEPLVEPLETVEPIDEISDVVVLESAQSGAEGDVEMQPDSPSDPPTAPAPTQISANVREQGGRYMHRMPRRMRRKMRGGDREQDRRDTNAGGADLQIVRPESPRPSGRSERSERSERSATPSITDLLKEGQEIIVQIAKEPLGQKGARITSHIALPGRYVVYMPTVDHTGVSRKIASDEERQRLKKILQIHHVGVPGGFIVRTAGEGKSEADIAADMNFLANLWMDIRQKAEKHPAPVLLHHDLDIVERTLRDQFTDQFKDVWVDNEEMYERVLSFVERVHPNLVPRVKLYTRSEPIFDAFNITAELEKALRPKVWLKSGGYIVINQTEALVAIDVNTGKYVGRSNRLEDTIVKTNTEAVKEIVRQVRLRDLGGIIVVDFIDMDERKNRQKVMQALEDAMRADRAPYKILQFNDFGLVAITRKRVKQSLERSLCMPCPHCEGAGYVKSVQTIVGEILQEAHKIASAVEGKDVMLRVHPDVAKTLKSSANKYLEELEEILRRPVLVRADPLLHHEKFDLA